MKSIESILKEKARRIKPNGRTEIVIDEPVKGMFKYVPGETIISLGFKFTYQAKGEDGCYYFIMEKNEAV